MSERQPITPKRKAALEKLRTVVMQRQSDDLIPEALPLRVPRDYADQHLRPGGLTDVEQELDISSKAAEQSE